MLQFHVCGIVSVVTILDRIAADEANAAVEDAKLVTGCTLIMPFTAVSQ